MLFLKNFLIYKSDSDFVRRIHVIHISSKKSSPTNHDFFTFDKKVLLEFQKTNLRLNYEHFFHAYVLWAYLFGLNLRATKLWCIKIKDILKFSGGLSNIPFYAFK